MEKLRQNEFHCSTLSLKAYTEISINGSHNTFKAYLRLKQDSVIWISIIPMLGIELARVLITTDSIKMMNRSESTYFAGDYKYLSGLFDADFSFELLQALILGNSFGLDEMDKIRSSTDHGFYLLSSLKKRKLKKMIEKSGKKNDLLYSNWLYPQNYRIAKLLIYDFVQHYSIFAEFKEIKTIGDKLLPGTVSFNIKSKKNVDLQIEYSKISIDKELKFPFHIPDKYKPVSHEHYDN